jgi:hypothetical protein
VEGDLLLYTCGVSCSGCCSSISAEFRLGTPRKVGIGGTVVS